MCRGQRRRALPRARGPRRRRREARRASVCHVTARTHDEWRALADADGSVFAPYALDRFAPLAWQPEEEREFDDYVQCTECSRWFHFVYARRSSNSGLVTSSCPIPCAHVPRSSPCVYRCGMYPAPEQLPRAWRIEAQLFVCAGCTHNAPTVGKARRAAIKHTHQPTLHADHTCHACHTHHQHVMAWQARLQVAKLRALQSRTVRVSNRGSNPRRANSSAKACGQLHRQSMW